MVKPITSRQMHSPGGTKYHQSPWATAPDWLAESSRVPHDGLLGSPRPRNESVDSDRIDSAMISTVLAKISGSTLGRICLRRIQVLPAPSACERSTNVRSFTDSTWLRMIRDVPAQPVMPITKMMIASLPPGQL